MPQTKKAVALKSLERLKELKLTVPRGRPRHRRPEEWQAPAEVRKIRRELKAKIKIKKKPLPPEEEKKWMLTGIKGVDEMFEKGIPSGASVLIAGGAGTGKTIFCLQTLAYGCSRGERGIYLSFEESEERLRSHMRSFGWPVDDFIKKGLLIIKRMDPFDVSKSIEALLAKAKGELMIEFEGIPGLIPPGFKPNRVVLDSLTAIASAFVGKEETYRIYIEQLFRQLERLSATSFLVSETMQVPQIYSSTGVEEFLADGVIVLYNIRKENIRISALEILKMRGAKHEKKLVPFTITDGKGLEAYPTEEIFESMG